jgi:hypothetical protein
VLVHALVHLLTHGLVRLAIDWTIEGHQHLLVVSLVVGRRAAPNSWPAYAATVVKGRRPRDEPAVIRRALMRVIRKVGPRRVRVTAERGCADVTLFALLTELRVAFVIRVKKYTTVRIVGVWYKRKTLRFGGNTRRRAVGRLLYGARSPQSLCMTMSRQRDAQGKGGLWYVVTNRPDTAEHAVAEYARHSGCDTGLRDAKWCRGFVHARSKQSSPWSRLFALVAIALLVMLSLASRLL